MPSLLRSFEQGSSIQLLQSEQARQLQHSSPDPATHNEQGKKQRKKQREYGTPFRRIVGLGTARRVRVKDGSASSTPSFMAKIGTLNASDSRTPVGKARAIAAACVYHTVEPTEYYRRLIHDKQTKIRKSYQLSHAGTRPTTIAVFKYQRTVVRSNVLDGITCCVL